MMTAYRAKNRTVHGTAMGLGRGARLTATALRVWLACAAMILPLIGYPPAGAAESTTNSQRLKTITSASGRFRVHAETAATAVRAGLEADRLAERFSRLLGVDLGVEPPIQITIFSVDTPDAQVRGLLHGYVQGLMRLELRMGCYQQVQEYPFHVGLIELFLCKLVYPAQWGYQTRSVELPPPWVVLGISALLEPSLSGPVKPSLPEAGEAGVLRVGEIIEAALVPDNPAEKSILSAYSALLVRSLLALPGGTELFHRWLKGWGREKGVAADALFWSVYGGAFESRKEMEKWWLLQVSRTEDRMGPGSMTFIETMRKLDELLPTPAADLPQVRGVASIPSGMTTLNLEELWNYKRHPRYVQLVVAKRYGIISLFVKANRAAAPVLDAYLSALDAMLQTSQSRFMQKLEEAKRLRDEAQQMMGSVARKLDDLERENPRTGAEREENLDAVLERVREKVEQGGEEQRLPPPQNRVRSYIDHLEDWAQRFR
jgi:hypothetical protein